MTKPITQTPQGRVFMLPTGLSDELMAAQLREAADQIDGSRGPLERLADAAERIADALTAKPCDDCAKHDAYAAREAEQREAAEPDPLDEDDLRDRVDRVGDRWCRNPDGCWHLGDAAVHPWRDCGVRLVDVTHVCGPLAFAPEPPPDATGDDPSASQPEPDREDGDDADDAPEALLCPECEHAIGWHDGGCDKSLCECLLSPDDIARALIAEAVQAERLRLAGELRSLLSTWRDDSAPLALFELLATRWEQQ